jgi:tetratricopeptide (TPR) repeat protein
LQALLVHPKYSLGTQQPISLTGSAMILNRSSLQTVCQGLLIACILIATLNSATAVDQLTRRSDRTTFRGEFTEMTTEVVRIRLSGGQTEEIPVSDIFAVRFDGEPPTLSQAQSNERSGSLDTALTRYQEIQQEYDGENKQLVTDLKFLIARTKVKAALADPARRDEAIKAIQSFRSENKTNFRYLESTLLEAQLVATDAARVEDARQLLREVEASSVKGYQLQAGVQLGRLLLGANNLAEALTAFDKVIQQSAGDAGSTGALLDGLLGRAMCLQKQGQSGEAVRSLDEVISRAGESATQTLAEAWVLKGDCFRAQDQPKDALYAYLHVDVLYASEPAAHAEALYRLAGLWAPAGHQDRADDALQRLTEKYPNSSWAKQPVGSVP